MRRNLPNENRLMKYESPNDECDKWNMCLVPYQNDMNPEWKEFVAHCDSFRKEKRNWTNDSI